MSKMIIFDMDGTVYDLYGVRNWLDKLTAEDVSAYTDGEPLVDLIDLSAVCRALIDDGYEIGVVTWLSMGGTKKFNRAVTEAKREWVNKNMPYVSMFVAQEYGTPKQTALNRKIKKAILVDDNEKVRKMWDTPIQRKSIDANGNIIKELWKLLRY